jgi:hypothetical protein
MDILIFKPSPISKFLEERSFIERLHVGLYLLSYIAMWAMGAPADVPQFSFIVTFFFIPLISMGYMTAISNILFIRNFWYYLFCTTTISINIYIFSLFKDIPYNERYGGYELVHIIIGASTGFFMPYVISFPFKILHGYFHDVEMYFPNGTIDKLQKKADPVKVKESFKYDSLNETQLDAELQAALREERFEDAEKIQKVLDKKFK